ncbi:MAG TPA: hypothetical protein VLX68_11250 [Chitinivibrionales bacterium]|nr:hypothetical protein [Chitinivibrionales bacterium]
MSSVRRSVSFALLVACAALRAAPFDSLKLSDFVSAKGYVKDLQITDAQNLRGTWALFGLVHNRFDATLLPNGPVSLTAGMRNLFLYGDLASDGPDLAQLTAVTPGYFGLNRTFSSGPSYKLTSELDRLYLQYASDKLQVRAGRSRVNWGMNLVWNPNDLFNASSYLDFDYEEKQGTDGAVVSWFPSVTSQLTAVYEAGDSLAAMGGAALARWNVWGYDMQVLGGIVKGDGCAGLGWSGQIGGGAFRGEATYFRPVIDKQGRRESVAASVSGDYTFPHNLYVQASVLYNSAGSEKKHENYSAQPMDGPLAKHLSPAAVTLFLECADQITPLVRIDAFTMVNPIDGSGVAGPTVTFSITNNIDFDLICQGFYGEKNTTFGGRGTVAVVRGKWSF